MRALLAVVIGVEVKNNELVMPLLKCFEEGFQLLIKGIMLFKRVLNHLCGERLPPDLQPPSIHGCLIYRLVPAPIQIYLKTGTARQYKVVSDTYPGIAEWVLFSKIMAGVEGDGEKRTLTIVDMPKQIA